MINRLFAELHIDCYKVEIDENNGWTNGGILLTINLRFQNKLNAARCKNSRFIILDDLSLVRSQCLLTRSSDLWFLPRFSDEITHASMKGFIIDNMFPPYTYIGIIVFRTYIAFISFTFKWLSFKNFSYSLKSIHFYLSLFHHLFIYFAFFFVLYS